MIRGKNKFQRIVEGWGNLLKNNPKAEEVATKRAIICAKCPKLNGILFCTRCGCFVPAKIRSIEEKCKENLW